MIRQDVNNSSSLLPTCFKGDSTVVNGAGTSKLERRNERVKLNADRIVSAEWSKWRWGEGS